jgi:hypothetical protein
MDAMLEFTPRDSQKALGLSKKLALALAEI